MIRDSLDRLVALQQRLKRGRSVNVNDRQTKDDIIAVATAYFTADRSVLVEVLGESEALLAHDEKWQDLIRLAHGNNVRKSYVRLIRDLQKELGAFSVVSLSRSTDEVPGKANSVELAPAELSIIRTLESAVPSAAASYRQAILDLRTERLSYRGTASELRESLRETLDHLAPDKEVMAQPDYKPEPNQSKPTMKQKTQYILGIRGKGKTQRATVGKAIELIDAFSGEIARAVYNQASLATHVETSRSEVWKVKRYVDTVFFDLLEIPEHG